MNGKYCVCVCVCGGGGGGGGGWLGGDFRSMFPGEGLITLKCIRNFANAMLRGERFVVATGYVRIKSI